MFIHKSLNQTFFLLKINCIMQGYCIRHVKNIHLHDFSTNRLFRTIMKHLIFFLAFCLPLFLSAQKNFQKGYIVSLAGDTTRGFIDYKEWNSSPESILF